MSSLTIRIEGVLDDALDAIIRRGFAKTKSEAVRLALSEFAKEHALLGREKSIHARAEDYAWDEIKTRLKLDVR